MEILIEVGKQVPALAVLVFVVWTFLKHLEARDKAMREVHEQMHREHLDARQLSRLAIEETTKAIRDNIATREGVINALNNLNRKQQT